MKIIEKLRICPPEGSVPDSSIPFSFLDVIFLDSHRIQRCFFFSYPHSTSHFLDSHLPILKSSLSLTLHHFYPLAGIIRLSPDSKEQYEIYYKEGDSISLTIAESEDNFQDLSETKPHDSSNIQPLVPESNEDDDLLAIQLTVFPNHGICIVVSIHHAACDGFSYSHFVKSWASICSSASPLPLTSLPSIDRTVLDNLQPYYLRYLKERQQFGSMLHKSETKTDVSLCTIFRISLEQIEKLKMWVHAKAKLLEKSLPYCSAYVVSSAYAWLCNVKLRKYSDDQNICFMLPVDWRRRLEPAAPAMYFGNCVLHSFVKMKAGDLTKDDNGVMFACEAIGNKIEELGSGIFGSVKKGDEDKAHIFAGNPILTIGGSNRFGVYGVDFGWGKPIKVEMFVDGEGFYMTENGDEPRGVEIGVVLPKHEMEEFITIFEEGLAFLSQT